MKIIHFIPSLDRASGGTSSYMQLLTNELGKLVDLYIITSPSENPLQLNNAKTIFIPCGWKEKQQMKREWIKLLDTIHPNIVHINCCWLPQCAWAQLWAQKLGYKVILTPHGMLEPWIIKRHYWTKKLPALFLYQKKAIINADCIHATADSEKANLLKLNYNNNIEVIANGIDVKNIQIKQNWKRNKRILFLSRIHIKKGIEFLLEAVSLLKNNLQGYIIEIAGEGDKEYLNQLQLKTKELHIDSLVKFCGGIYDKQKWELFQNADVFILPTFSENFGIVVAEALACGTPVITTKGTPWKELETAHCGWWTEIGTQPTADALNKFLQLSVQELETMGRNGRKLVEQKYSSQKMAENMVELYHKVCKQK